MKKKSVFLCWLLSCVLITNAQDSAKLKQLDYLTALEMQDNYDGWFRKHTKTDGLIIQADKLMDLIKPFSGKKIGLIYGRRLTKEKGYGHRVTIILVVYETTAAASGGRVSAEQYLYYDLGEISLCPPPRMCDLAE